MKVMVTGATGFIGEHYVKHLRHKQVEVFACCRNAAQSEPLRKLGVHIFCGDLLDEPFVTHICKQMDVVVHCAGKSGVWGDYQLYYYANVVATENLISACQSSGVSRFINISTPSVYFDLKDHLNIRENFLPKRFIDNYARTKYQAETRVTAAHADQLGTVSLRPRMVIGPGDKYIFPRMIALHKEGKLKRIGQGRNLVSITTLENMLLALDLCVFGSETVLGKVYNIANAEPVLLWELVDEVMAQLKLPPVTQSVPYSVAYGAGWMNERAYCLLNKTEEPSLMRLKVALMARSMTLNIDNARRNLGYHPLSNVSSTVEEFADWWHARHVD